VCRRKYCATGGGGGGRDSMVPTPIIIMLFLVGKNHVQ